MSSVDFGCHAGDGNDFKEERYLKIYKYNRLQTVIYNYKRINTE
jgi:hypothetical protein